MVTSQSPSEYPHLYPRISALPILAERSFTLQWATIVICNLENPPRKNGHRVLLGLNGTAVWLPSTAQGKGQQCYVHSLSDPQDSPKSLEEVLRQKVHGNLFSWNHGIPYNECSKLVLAYGSVCFLSVLFYYRCLRAMTCQIPKQNWTLLPGLHQYPRQSLSWSWIWNLVRMLPIQ